MHGSIRDRLEDLLRQNSSARCRGTSQRSTTLEEVGRTSAVPAMNVRRIEAMERTALCCGTCAARGTEAEPRRLLARVMQRLKNAPKESIWAVFVYSPFGKRLTYASSRWPCCLGTYVIARKARDGHLGGRHDGGSGCSYMIRPWSAARRSSVMRFSKISHSNRRASKSTIATSATKRHGS